MKHSGNISLNGVSATKLPGAAIGKHMGQNPMARASAMVSHVSAEHKAERMPAAGGKKNVAKRPGYGFKPQD